MNSLNNHYFRLYKYSSAVLQVGMMDFSEEITNLIKILRKSIEPCKVQ